MRVLLRCRLPGCLRARRASAHLAFGRNRRHYLKRQRLWPRVVVRIRIPRRQPEHGRAAEAIRGCAQHIEGPWHSQPKVAVLSPWFPVNGTSRVFRDIALDKLERFQPGAIAGPVPELRKLATAVVKESIQLPGLQYAIIVLTGPTSAPLTEQDRELFWRAFQVPVYEQYRGDAGELLAAECDAHAGLHLFGNDRGLVLTGTEIVSEPCACGATTPRAVRRAERSKAHVLAATAGV